MAEPNVLVALEAVILERKNRPPESGRSYVAKLMAGGVAAIGAKVIEESAEVVEAADEPGVEGRGHLVHEAADLVFHLMVLLGHAEIPFAEVEAELARRFGIGGLVEKESRGT